MVVVVVAIMTMEIRARACCWLVRLESVSVASDVFDSGYAYVVVDCELLTMVMRTMTMTDSVATAAHFADCAFFWDYVVGI